MTAATATIWLSVRSSVTRQNCGSPPSGEPTSIAPSFCCCTHGVTISLERLDRGVARVGVAVVGADVRDRAQPDLLAVALDHEPGGLGAGDDDRHRPEQIVEELRQVARGGKQPLHQLRP